MRVKILLVVLAFPFYVILAQDGTDTVPGMVFIPQGTFMLGHGEDAGPDYGPAVQVHSSAFWMDEHEVTNQQYLEFCRATGHKLPEFWGMEEFCSGEGFPDHPVIGINVYDATKYAEWAGKRLPTEVEWEYAARGGLKGMVFPDGNELLAEQACIKGSQGPMKVGSYQPNEWGLYDMAGNVWEWTADRYVEDYKDLLSKKRKKKETRFQVIRGGSWHSGSSCCRVYFRNALPPNWVDFAVGFRCVKDFKQY